MPENSGLAFAGQRAPPAFIVPERRAGRLLAEPNPSGRTNADVLRPLVGAADLARPHGRWVIDFPPDGTAVEAALYLAPRRHLVRTRRARRGRWWTLPRPVDGLRATLARHERVLVGARAAREPGFTWLEAPALPDESLLVVARDDDFAHGVLASSAFAAWWRAFRGCRASARVVLSFPFPWPPATPLGRLTTIQEEQRHALARAARSAGAPQIDAAVAAAYGWPADANEAELMRRLLELHHHRLATGR